MPAVSTSRLSDGENPSATGSSKRQANHTAFRGSELGAADEFSPVSLLCLTAAVARRGICSAVRCWATQAAEIAFARSESAGLVVAITPSGRLCLASSDKIAW